MEFFLTIQPFVVTTVSVSQLVNDVSMCRASHHARHTSHNLGSRTKASFLSDFTERQRCSVKIGVSRFGLKHRRQLKHWSAGENLVL